MAITNELDYLIPNDSFLSRYMEYVSPLTDAPSIFHVASALAILGAAVGRNITYEFGDNRFPPNMYVLLVAPTSLYRKTTALNSARRLLWDVNPERVLPNEVTSEALIEQLVKTPQGLLTYSEFGGLLAQAERKYMAGFKELLTDLYDCPPQYTRCTKGGLQTISNPSLSILAGSAVTWLAGQMKEGDLRGGWLVRFLMIPVRQREGFVAIPPKADSKLREHLRVELAEISKLTGIVSLHGIQEQYADWLRGFEKHVERSDHPEITGGFVSRLSQYAIKIAILLEASCKRSGISEESLDAAIRFVEHIFRQTNRLLDEDFAQSWVDGQIKKVEKRLTRRPGQIEDHSSLLRYMHLGAKQFESVMQTMRASDRVEELTDGKAKLYRLKVRVNSQENWEHLSI